MSKSPSTWTADFLASLVVFMVALPLCIGIAQACGLSPEAGIVTGIVGGLIVGIFSGSPLQVSGPAAGLIVLVIQFLDEAKHAGYSGTTGLALLGIVILLAGVLQITAGVFRLGQWFRAVAPAVVGGMLAGIGITIIAKQFHVLVDDTPPKDVIEGLYTIPLAIWKGFFPPSDALANHQAAAIIGALTLVILTAWKLTKPTKLKFIPSAVVAVLLSVFVTEAAGFHIARVQVSSNLLDGLAPVPMNWPGFEVFGMGFLWKAVLTFALIASAETLLCAVAVDAMQSGPRTKYDRELMAQGAGNMLCGVLGALPMTGVIVRSSANVDAGAKTRLSTILHGVWLLLLVALLPDLLSRIPVASLAAVLVYTGWKLVNIPAVVKLWKESRGEALIYIITALTIISTDLLAGVLLGVVLSAAKVLWMFSSLKISRRDDLERNEVHITLDGAGTFLQLPKIAKVLDSVPMNQTVHLSLERMRLVDHAVLTLLMNFRDQYEIKGGRVLMDWERLRSSFDDPAVNAPVEIEAPRSDTNGKLTPAARTNLTA